ncbi:MAG TPA: cytochrome c oxidase subunit II [Herpetosiphonaceae bacterium]|nr:cytochrome c oxidase subunit II [Herpetosiphonaceae bacterium]
MLPSPKRLLRLLSIGTALLPAMVALSACGQMYEAPQTMFSRQGSSSSEILSLYNIFFWAAVAVFVVVEGALVYSVFRYRRRPEDGIPVQLHGNQPIEILWTIAPAVLVLFLATMTFRTQSVLVAPSQDPVRVRVVGHQWWWEFQYPDYNIVTANELHIPENRDIEFALESVDVVHAFWFPRLGGKTDVVPGHTNRLNFRAFPTGEPVLIRGECAEFCGGTHAQMAMWAVVEPQASFDAWVRQQQAEAPLPAGITQAAAEGTATAGTATAGTTATAGAAAGEAATAGTAAAGETATAGTDTPGPNEDTDTSGETAPTIPAPATAEAAPLAQGAGIEARGYQLFQTKGCVGCHAIAGFPEAQGRIGPDLTHVGSRQHIVAGWLENTPDNMRRWLRDPNEVKPDNYMGAVVKRGYLNEDEIEALTAYLESLK